MNRSQPTPPIPDLYPDTSEVTTMTDPSVTVITEPGGLGAWLRARE